MKRSWFIGALVVVLSGFLSPQLLFAQNMDHNRETGISLRYVKGSSVKLEQINGDCEWVRALGPLDSSGSSGAGHFTFAWLCIALFHVPSLSPTDTQFGPVAVSLAQSSGRDGKIVSLGLPSGQTQ